MKTSRIRKKNHDGDRPLMDFLHYYRCDCTSRMVRFGTINRMISDSELAGIAAEFDGVLCPAN